MNAALDRPSSRLVGKGAIGQSRPEPNGAGRRLILELHAGNWGGMAGSRTGIGGTA